MKNKIIGIFILLLLGIIILMVVKDFSSSRIDNIPENKYELNMDSLKDIGQYPISHHEIKQINLANFKAKSIEVSKERIYISSDSAVRVINEEGKLIEVIQTKPDLRTLKYENSIGLILVYKNNFEILNSAGKILIHSSIENDKAVFTSVAIYHDSLIVIADAGNRLVHFYDLQGKKLSSIKGFYNSSNDRLGFIIPSPYFDIAVNKEDELWAVNPGIHALQNYNLKGDLLAYWKKESNSVEGFTGCCNPAHMTVLENGNFVTSEKGLVRIKIYTKEGELLSIVAPPLSFTDKGQAPDIAVYQNKIYALDFDKKTIRIFKRKHNG